ncbi:unnamed protein product [Allacma fusca]|uniref:Uncharacterized protein n=1 Tax=Allacma fusca TaxID=39272 RepID=A0A8J2PG02_9HEXA|nr:unnamed protein product [Allacma fusca]
MLRNVEMILRDNYQGTRKFLKLYCTIVRAPTPSTVSTTGDTNKSTSTGPFDTVSSISKSEPEGCTHFKPLRCKLIYGSPRNWEVTS